MKNSVVYKSSPENVNHVVNILRKNGIDPIILDDPSVIVLWTSKDTYRVRIAVPENQKIAALDVIAKESNLSKNRVKELTHAVNLDLLKALLVYIFICFLFFLIGGEWETSNFGWSFILTIVFLAILRVINEKKQT